MLDVLLNSPVGTKQEWYCQQEEESRRQEDEEEKSRWVAGIKQRQMLKQEGAALLGLIEAENPHASAALEPRIWERILST